jgi:hypothetical protein
MTTRILAYETRSDGDLIGIRGSTENWREVSKCNPIARSLADGHYTYRPVKSRKMGREVGPPGQKIVMLTPDGRAVWGSHRPAPWSGVKRADGFEGATCFIYRNTGYSVMSSALIREAVGYTASLWGVSRFLTYVGVEYVGSSNPGYCFIKAGFVPLPGFSYSSKIGVMRKLVMTADEVGQCFVEYLSWSSNGHKSTSL